MAETNHYTVGTTAKHVSARPESPKKIYNAGASNLGVNTTSAVVATDNALSTGQSVTITSDRFIISAASSHVIETVYDAPSQAGSFRSPEFITGAGPPKSGTEGTGEGLSEPGGLYLDTTNGLLSWNEGTSASPYWTPTNYNHPALFGVNTDFRGKFAEAVADTDAAATFADGLRVFGDGLVETDSGFIAGTSVEGSYVGRMTTTAADAKLIAIGTDAGIMQPDQHQQMVIDATLTNVSAITLRGMFFGFLGSAADGMTVPITYATTTATFGIDDLFGMAFSVDLTDTTGIYTLAETNNLAGTQALATTGDTLVNIAAAGTYQRFRVECDSDGVARAFIDKAQVATIAGGTAAGTHSATAAAADPTEEYTPVLYLESTSAATKSIDLKRFATWAYR